MVNLKKEGDKQIEELIEELKEGNHFAGFRVYYWVLNPYLSEHDNGESYLKPVCRTIDILWKKITRHYLIYSRQFFGLRISRKDLAIIDECPEKELRKRCLEEAQKFLKNF